MERRSQNSGLQAARELGPLWGGGRRLGELGLGEHPRWGFGFFVTLEARSAPAALATLFRAVGLCVKLRLGLFMHWRVPGGTSCNARERDPQGPASLVMPWVPSANVPFNVPCSRVPASDAAAVVANCREAAERGCQGCSKEIQSKIRQCQSVAATRLSPGS